MLVEWTQARVYSIWTNAKTVPGAPPAAKLETTLVPGINEVDDEMWGRIAQHPNVKHYLEAGDLKVQNPPKDGPDRKKNAKGLLQYQIIEAKKLVRQTYDKQLLLEWKENDTRAGITSEIDRQITKIDATARPKTEEEKNESRFTG